MLHHVGVRALDDLLRKATPALLQGNELRDSLYFALNALRHFCCLPQHAVAKLCVRHFIQSLVALNALRHVRVHMPRDQASLASPSGTPDQIRLGRQLGTSGLCGPAERRILQALEPGAHVYGSTYTLYPTPPQTARDLGKSFENMQFLASTESVNSTNSGSNSNSSGQVNVKNLQQNSTAVNLSVQRNSSQRVSASEKPHVPLAHSMSGTGEVEHQADLQENGKSAEPTINEQIAERHESLSSRSRLRIEVAVGSQLPVKVARIAEEINNLVRAACNLLDRIDSFLPSVFYL